MPPAPQFLDRRDAFLRRTAQPIRQVGAGRARRVMEMSVRHYLLNHDSSITQTDWKVKAFPGGSCADSAGFLNSKGNAAPAQLDLLAAVG